jgi:hypothetical protein
VQSRVADVVEHLGVDWPNGENPGHGGEPPAAPPAEGKPRQHQKTDPNSVGDEHRSDQAPTVTEDEPGQNGRHLGQDGTNPSTSTPNDQGRGNEGAGTSNAGRGFHRGWPHMPTTTTADIEDNQGPPESAAQDNHGGSN